MAEQQQNSGEHFLPVRRAELVERMLTHPRLADEREKMRRLSGALTDLFHVEYHRRQERLKELYAPIDPNADTVPLARPPSAMLAVQGGEVTPTRTRALQRSFAEELKSLLERANFREVTKDDLDLAFKAESVFHVKLHTNLADFAELSLYRRGRSHRQEEISSWFGLRKRTLDVEYFERVALYVRFQPPEHFPEERRARLPFKPGSTVLKLFENIPVADLEMLFPNSEVRMRPLDQVMLGVPAVLGGVAILGKLGATALLVAGFVMFWMGMREHPVSIGQGELIALGAAFFTLSMFVNRQLGRFKFRRLQFFKVLADSLYYRNLDNNAGVIHRLIDSAEEEEAKEAILGFAFLHVGGTATAAELDARVESWFDQDLKVPVDFEVDDALAKLERLGLVTREGERWTAESLDDALETLEYRWSKALAAEA